MSRTGLRYSSAALAGSLVVGLLINQSAIATTGAATPLDDSVIDRAIASIAEPQTAQSEVPQAITTGVVVPALTHFSIPDQATTAKSVGFALGDLLIDVDPDLGERDLAFVLQRKQGEAWVEAATGTTSGPTELATVEALPAGTYRVILPAQFGLAESVGAPFEHQPRQLAASLAFTSGNVRTTVDVSPDPTGTYRFTLQRKNGDAWQNVSTHETSTPDGGFAFTDLPSGTYRIVAPNQANAIGATSNEVKTISRADQQRAAEAAAAAAAREAARAEQASASSSTPSRSSSSSAAPAPRPVTDAPPVANAGGIVGTALAQVGDRYVLGGSGPNAFDCSGLTSYAYRSAGISIPRTAASQWAAAKRVTNPRPGDLVFFNGAGHVGIYIGNGKMVHAANPSRPVEVISISSSWYGRTFMGFGRF